MEAMCRDVSSSESCVSGMRKDTPLPPCLNFSVVSGGGLLRRGVAYRYRPAESFLSSSVILFPKIFEREPRRCTINSSFQP